MPQTIKFKTKKEAKERLNLMLLDENYHNCQIVKIDGDLINKGYIVKFNTQK